jgi:hypothetical protein
LRADELATSWREDGDLLLHGSRVFILDVVELWH